MNSRLRYLVAGALLLFLAGCGLFGDDPELNTEGSPTSSVDAADDAGTQAEEQAEGQTTSSTTEAATSAPVADDSPTPAVADLVWESCGADFDCADVAVPIDHDVPDGETMTMALVRRPATGARLGSIFVNPGGPGASGVDYVRGGFSFDADTMAAYDLIGFDPRGIGASGALGCDVSRSTGPLPDHSPDDATEADELNAEAKAFAEGCAAAAEALLANLDTESVARDLDLARAAVGDTTLHYYGFSFGTLIGQVYAGLFPEKVGHMVLDGVVDPTASLSDLLRQQAAAFEESFIVLDNACGRALSCPDGGVIETYDRLLADLEQSGPQGEVGPAEFEYAALVTLYSEQLWSTYVTALEQADAGDLSGIESLSDLFVSGVSFAAYAGVECTDSPRPDGPEAWDEFADELSAIAPRFGATVANELRTCAFWPVGPGPDRQPVAAPGAAPILVIGNTNDPATPLANAQLVAENLESASLIVLEADRHTAYRASTCVQSLVSAYFLNDAVPLSPTNCES